MAHEKCVWIQSGTAVVVTVVAVLTAFLPATNATEPDATREREWRTWAAKLPDPAYVTPSDNPSLPAWADAFSSGFGGATGRSAPIIGNGIRQADPSNRITVSGYKFTNDTKFVIYGQTATGLPNYGVAPNLHLDHSQSRAIINVPASFPSNSMYLVWPHNAAFGYGPPFAVNQTEAWWLQCSSTGETYGSAGDSVSVFGRNLSGPGGRCAIYLQPGGGSGQCLLATDVNPYRVQFTLPNGLASSTWSTTSVTVGLGAKTLTVQTGLAYVAGMEIIVQGRADAPHHTMTGTITSYNRGTGALVINVTTFIGSGSYASWRVIPTYQIWLHNGHGGIYGWSQCLQSVKVQNPIPYNAKVVHMSDYIAADTGNDCTTAFNSALATIGATAPPTAEWVGCPGTIIFGAGTYLFSGTFYPSGSFGQQILMQGQGQGVTFIKPRNDFSPNTGTNSLIYGGSGRLTGITFDATGFTLANVVGSLTQADHCDFKYPSPAFLKRTLNGVDSGGLGKATVLTNCNITGCGYFVQYNNAGALVDSCNFYETNGTAEGFYTWSTPNCSVTNCTCQDLNVNGTAAQRGYGRFAAFDPFGTTVRNIYVGNCQTISLGPPPGAGGTGEQILSESSLYVDSKVLASASVSGGVTVLTWPNLPLYDWTGLMAFITAGTGEGQYAIIASTDFGSGGSHLALDRLLNVTPDSTSRVDVCSGTCRLVSYKNTQQGTGSIAASASTGFSMYTANTDCICDSCTMDNMAYGIMHWSLSNFSKVDFFGGVQPAFFNLHQNLTMTRCTTGLRIMAGNGVVSFHDLATSNGTSHHPIITSASYRFTANDVNSTISLVNGAYWTISHFQINSVSGGRAVLDRACGTHDSLSGGFWTLAPKIQTPGTTETGVYLGNVFRNITYSNPIPAKDSFPPAPECIYLQSLYGPTDDLLVIDKCNMRDAPVALDIAYATTPTVNVLLAGCQFNLGAGRSAGSQQVKTPNNIGAAAANFNVINSGTTFTGYGSVKSQMQSKLKK